MVKRYYFDGHPEESPDGGYISHSDHLAELAKLRKELEARREARGWLEEICKADTTFKVSMALSGARTYLAKSDSALKSDEQGAD